MDVLCIIPESEFRLWRFCPAVFGLIGDSGYVRTHDRIFVLPETYEYFGFFGFISGF